MATVIAPVLNLARAEGHDLFTAGEAILKGCLESEAAIHHVVSPRAGWRGDRSSNTVAAMLRVAQEDSVARLLAAHGCTVEAVPDGMRALAVAMQTARSGRRAIALIPNSMLDGAIPMLELFSRGRVEGEGAICVLMEDRPDTPGAACPRRTAMRLNWPCLEAFDISSLRDMIEYAMRLSRAGVGRSAMPAAIVVHESILRQLDTLECRPNRVMDRMDLAVFLRRRRRIVRPGEGGDVLRQARRYELNRQASPPSRGERVAAGFIVIGPAAMTMQHLLHDLKLGGRVPVLKLGLVQPVDEAVVSRFLERVKDAVVLEPRPGSIGPAILNVAESMRRRGESPGLVWWKSFPPGEGLSEADVLLEPGDALKPSVLARKGLHVFHAIRPSERLSARLAKVDPELMSLNLPPRGQTFGPEAMLREIRRRLGGVDRWLREQTEAEDSDTPPSVLAIEGVEPEGPQTRVVAVELFTRRAFLNAGAAAVRHAARHPRPRLIIVADLGDDDDPDLERFARAAIPSERSGAAGRRRPGEGGTSGEHPTVTSVDLGVGAELEETLRAAALEDRVTVVVVRDGPTSSHDPVAVEASFLEVDRLGFQPRQRLVLPAEYAVEFGSGGMSALPEGEVRSAVRREAIPSRSELTIERIAKTWRTPIDLRIRPLLEQVEVVRTKPPAPARRIDLFARVALPRIEHASAGVWRAHIAGCRGPSPGSASLLIAEAGKAMGYHVRMIVEPTAVAPGRRAWTQILFTRSATVGEAARFGDGGPPLTSQVPWGEADLMLGVDPVETVRAMGPDENLRVADTLRTFAVINDAPLEDQYDDDIALQMADRLADAAGRATRADSTVEPFASLCRSYFFTDRLTDLVMVGVAFQKGLIPVTIEAIEAAARRLEARGFGRSLEAILIGRRLALGELRLEMSDRDEPVERLVRRMVLSISRGGWPDRRDSDAFEHLVRSALSKLIAAGRGARTPDLERELVTALYRAAIWGGVPYAAEMADVLTPLLDDDGYGYGAPLLRLALPAVAEAMLIRDLFYLSTMAMSLEHRRRMRERLSVRLPRGDQIERRYLNRLEANGFGRRLRLEFRSSDWPARVTALVARVIPIRWRGNAAERDLRDYVLDLVRQVADADAGQREAWATSLALLHQFARQGRLRMMPVDEVARRIGRPTIADANPATLAAP